MPSPVLSPQQIKALASDPLVCIREQLLSLPEKPIFYLYGAGNLGKKMASGIVDKGANVLGFLDNNPELAGKEVEGFNVLPFDQIYPDDNSVCVITIWHYRHDPELSAKHAAMLGFKHILHFSSLAALWNIKGVLPNYAVDHPAILFNDQVENRIQRTLEFMADEESRGTVQQILSFHALPDPFSVPKLTNRMPPFNPYAIATYIDGGAFIGDDYESHLKEFPALKLALLVEPDPESFRILLTRNFPQQTEVKYVNAALSNNAGVITFQANGNWGSKVVEGGASEGAVSVPCVTLDDLAQGIIGPLYIKMDLEGHEISALQGAVGLLQRTDVVFSITLEHRALDLFEIPEFLVDFPERSHFLYPRDSEFCMDMVLYSVPNSMVSLPAAKPL